MINIFKGNALQSTALDELVYLETAAGAAVTGATLAFTLSKAAGAPAAITPTVTEHGGGYYKIAFTTAHFDTLGRASVEVSAATALTLSLQYTVVDAIFTAADRTIITAIKAKTDNLPASPANEVTVAAIKAKTDNLPASPANEVTAAAIKLKTDNLPASPANEVTSTAIKAKTDLIPAAMAQELHDIYRERCGKHSLNLATGVESVTLVVDEVTTFRTLYKDAAFTVPVTAATDPVLSMDLLA